ncbi:hypothetical protein QAD02_005897 [Eretmocerus hayati]|uniref:Uncharacterized protein n=1 Tax=Eretmocerus hayati TaxID=131215 RepID=A0ACC2MZJ6_9HYME|nr:hypothetical protein QAD02_005897 [Eretmocerus hayati]
MEEFEGGLPWSVAVEELHSLLIQYSEIHGRMIEICAVDSMISRFGFASVRPGKFGYPLVQKGPESRIGQPVFSETHGTGGFGRNHETGGIVSTGPGLGLCIGLSADLGMIYSIKYGPES